MDINTAVVAAIEKAKSDSDFYADLIKFIKLEALQHVPTDRVHELEEVFENGNLNDLFPLVNEYYSDFPKDILTYIEKY